jgi:broad specificity phosphatase PhoE
VKTLLLARHAHSTGNAEDVVNGVPPGPGLSPSGVEEAQALGRDLAHVSVELGVSSRLRRASETLELALADRDVPRMVEPLLDEIGFGAFEGGSLATYRAWAWAQGPAEACPGNGESRVAAAARVGAALRALLARPEATILAVSHGLPVRYVLDAADGEFPQQQLMTVPHGIAHRLERGQVEVAAQTLEAWALKPAFR